MRPLNVFSSPQLPELTLGNFRGLNNRNAATEIDDNESPDLLNVRFNEVGALSKRLGTALVGDDKGNLDVDSLYSAYYGNGSAKMLMVADSATANIRRLFYRTTGNWTELTAGGTALAQNVAVEFETFYDGANQMVFMLDGTNFQKFDPSANTLAAATASPATVGTILRVYKNRLYCVGNTSNPERIYFSGLGDGDSWGASDYFDVPSQNVTEKGTTGDPITALAVWADRLIIFKNRSIWAWDGTRLVQISNEHGCVGKRAFASTEYGLYFADNDGVYRLIGGNQIEKVSRKIKATWEAIPAARITSVCMAFFNGKLYVGTAAAGATYNNIILVNYTELPRDQEGQQPWVLWKGTTDDPLGASQFAVYEASTTTAPILAFGPTIAQTHAVQLETGDADLDYSAGTSTAAIASYYKTKVFSLYAQFKKLFATYKSAAATSQVLVTLDVDFGKQSISKNLDMFVAGSGVYGTGLYDTITYGGVNAIIGKFSTPIRGKFFQYTIQNNAASQPFTIYQLKQIYKRLRLR